MDQNAQRSDHSLVTTTTAAAAATAKQAPAPYELIPEGRVEQVCRQWLVHEDSGLAYRLQVYTVLISIQIFDFFLFNNFRIFLFRLMKFKHIYIRIRSSLN